MGDSARYPGSQYTSTTTGANFITYARYLVNEPTASFWNDTEMLQWVNEGIMDIVTKTWCLGQTETVTLAANTLEFTLANDYITVLTVHLSITATNVTKALIKGHPAMVGHVQDPSEIVYWYEFDGELGLYPMMSSVSGYTCSCYQVAAPAAIVSGGNSPLPAWFDDPLTKFVVAKALFKDNEVGTAQIAMDDYERSIERYTKDLLTKPPEIMNTVKGK